MFRYFFATFLCLLFVFSVSADEIEGPIVTHEFELNKDFCDVSFVMMRDASVIREKMNIDTLEQRVNAGTLILSNEGWVFVLEQSVVVNIRFAGKVNLVESIQVKKESIFIENKLDGEDSYFDNFRYTLEIVKEDVKTRVRAKFWTRLKQNHRHIVVRSMVRMNAKNLENALREAVGDKQE
jgi:hypothetical protein